MLFSEFCGFVANVLSNIAFLPQVIKIVRRKQVDDISLLMFVTLFITQLCWICYAVPLGARNLWISSLIEIAFLLPIFILWPFYNKSRA